MENHQVMLTERGCCRMKLIKWFYFLSKRLYKKWMFILLIFLVPVSVLALKITSNQKSGFVQIGIVNLASDTGEHIVDNLDGDKGIVTYTLYDTTDHAITELEADKLDAIWILPPNIEQRIADYVEHPNRDHYIIDVIKKEESLKTRLALETLSGAIYPFISRPFFLKCIRENTDFNVDHLTDEQI